MDLVPWHPFRELDRMRSAIDRVFGEPLVNWGGLTEPLHLRFPIEVMERANDVVVRAELAGIDPQDVDVRITDEGITVRGERKRETDNERDGVRHTERFYGTFARSVSFSTPVDSSRAKATFRNGLLEVTVPRRQATDGRDGRKLNIETH